MSDSRQRRRRVLGGGVAGFTALYVLGAAVMVPWVQDDLSDRVEAKALAAGMPGVEADFSGQDGTLRCREPIADPAALEALAEDVWGVRTATTDDCTVALPEPAPVETTTTTTAVPVATTAAPVVSRLEVNIALTQGAQGPVLTGRVDTEDQRARLVADLEEVFGVGKVTDQLEVAGIDGAGSDPLVADLSALAQGLADNVSSGEAGYDGKALYLTGTAVDAAADTRLRALAGASGVADDDVDLIVAPSTGLNASASVAAGSNQVTLSGTVESESQRTELVASAQAAFGADNVIDELIVSGVAAPANDAEAAALAGLVGVLTPNLTEGAAVYDSAGLSLTGVYVDDAAKAAVEAAASTAGVDPAAVTLEPRPAATADQAAQLEQELNDAVGTTPIPFDPGRSTLRPEADAILGQVAALARKYAGVTISVNGHTDADGSDTANLALSQARADTVLQALVGLGIPAEQLVAQGFGETQPVAANDTAENKALNRRVVFSVVPK